MNWLTRAMTGGVAVVGDQITTGIRMPTHPLGSVSARLDIITEAGSRMTVTRVGLGGLFLGPAGLIVGALAPKRTSKTSATIVLLGAFGESRHPIPRADYIPRAAQVVEQINKAVA